MKVQPQTNPQKINPNKGMEIFLSTPKKEEIQVGGEKMKLNNQVTQKEEIKVNNQTNEKMEVSTKEEVKKFDALEEKVREIEQKLTNSKTLELSAFNKIAYEKKLRFRLLFIREKIYVIVKDSTNTKTTIVGILPPRWGGTSLRYLITNCLEGWCLVVTKKTSKGEIYSYQSLNGASKEDDNDEDDIFD
jgi:hypothetical protein